ncbi:MAG: flagellar biosynthesis protein FlhB [Planctomycetota bacterium]|jgi:flagellar biosynthetic protein FlhB
MAEDLGERTEDATPRRRTEAREKGNVARSQDLSAVVLLLAATLAVWAAAASILGQGKVLIGQVLSSDFLGDPFDPGAMWPLAMYLGGWTIRLAAPIFAIAWLAAFASHLFQVGWLFSPKIVVPDLRKLNPTSGAKRIFGITAIVKASLDLLKVLIVATVCVTTILHYEDRMVRLPHLTAMQAVLEIGRFLLDLALRVLGVLLLLALMDLFYQRWKHSEDLKMTRQEVKDEMKQTDGDPQVKRRRLRMQQQIAMQRISAAVPKADVVVTNPQHISVAIQYDPQRMQAPRVVAKGADFLALRIRQIAMHHDIPIVERKPLARALYRDVEPGQEIPEEFYKAVAEILAYVYRLSGKMSPTHQPATL